MGRDEGREVRGEEDKFSLVPRPAPLVPPLKLATEAPVNGGRNYDGPKVAKFLVG